MRREFYSRLANSFSLGNALKNGVPVAIVGETNAGKSTLLNALVGEERAIVSDIHGTTRDVIEDTVNLGGTLFRFIDTAGIRDTRDRIETLGIERTFKKLKEAHIVLWLVDATCAEEQVSELAPKILPLCEGKRLVVVLNKSDLLEREELKAKSEELSRTLVRKDDKSLSASDTASPSPLSLDIFTLSAKDKAQVEAFSRRIASMVALPDEDGGVIVSNVRHYEALTRALAAIRRVQSGLATQLPTDLVAQDLRDCLSALADITGGAITTEETLHTIFSRFCVGK